MVTADAAVQVQGSTCARSKCKTCSGRLFEQTAWKFTSRAGKGELGKDQKQGR